MKKLVLILNLIISISLSEIIRVDINGNHDYVTIQSGVDNAEIGDTVVVYPGTYYENIILDKSIVLASLAIFDNLNNWFEYNDFTNAFKIYKRKTLLKLMPFVSENFNIFLELPLKIIVRKYNYSIIPINWKDRSRGKSKFKIR